MYINIESTKQDVYWIRIWPKTFCLSEVVGISYVLYVFQVIFVRGYVLVTCMPIYTCPVCWTIVSSPIYSGKLLPISGTLTVPFFRSWGKYYLWRIKSDKTHLKNELTTRFIEYELKNIYNLFCKLIMTNLNLKITLSLHNIKNIFVLSLSNFYIHIYRSIFSG